MTRHKPTYITGQDLKKNIPTPSEGCISSGFLKSSIDNFHSIKIFNLSDKSDFLRLFYREGDKVTSETLVKLQTSKPLIVGKQCYK